MDFGKKEDGDKKPAFGNKKMSKKVAKAKEFGGKAPMGKKGC